MAELRRLLPYIGRYRRLVWLGLLSITISNICSTTIPRVIGSAIDVLKNSVIDESTMLVLVARSLV
jgi:ABC-type multidrug transport system fused ATPase/permease subunit